MERYRLTRIGAFLLIWAAPLVVQSQIFPVAPGFDVFVTDPGATMFVGFPFVGEPIGQFDFGDGPVGVLDTDTIVRRGPGSGTPTIPAEVEIELVALSLRSVNPINIGFGQDFHFVTLNPQLPSPGQMSIHFHPDGNGGQYTSGMDVSFVVRQGGPNGPILPIPPEQTTARLELLSEPFGELPGPQPWGRRGGPGALKFKGINYRLNTAMNRDSDFWPGHQRNGWATTGCQPHGEAETFPAQHCINTTQQVPKWSQLPKQEFGENIASDVDWRDIMNPDGQRTAPNWVVADDFRSDGRPITNVKWFGSYFNPDDQPRSVDDPVDGSVTYVPQVEDGFAISFFRDIPANQNPDGGFSLPGDLLGSYITSEVHVMPALDENGQQIRGWDQHLVWEYQVDLIDTHPDHLLSGVTTPEAFFEKMGEIYWVSIAAENGHILEPDTWEAINTEDPIRDEHFWGWHTSPERFNDVPTVGDLLMPEREWRYNNWHPITTEHGDADMAFELLTQPTQHPCDFNSDNLCDIADINNLYAASGHNLVAGAPGFLGDIRDLDGDGMLTNDDLTLWLEYSAHFNGWPTPFRRGDTDEVGHMPNMPPMDKRDVDITDFNNLASNFSPGGVPPRDWHQGNFDGDKDIDITDFNLLASNFAPGPVGYGPSSVPEPSTMLLVGLACGMLSFAGWRARRPCF